jgi:hypothetical protein
MTVSQPKIRFGPSTYQVSDAGNINGRRMVEFDGTTGKVKLAVADSAKWLGVSGHPGTPGGLGDGSSTNWAGDAAFSYNAYPGEIPVQWTGEFLLDFTNTTGAQVTLVGGDAVYCDALGFVKKAGGAPTGRQVGIYVGTTSLVLAATTGTGSGYVRLFNG